MNESHYGIDDLNFIAAGGAILGSGGGGSYSDAVRILKEMASWKGSVKVRKYDDKTNCCVLAMMGSPDAADQLNLGDVTNSIANTVNAYEATTRSKLGCVIPVEVGPINSIVPLIAASMDNNTIEWVVDGDGAGRAVPELPQTTYSGNAKLAVSPASLANNAKENSAALESATLNALTAAQVEKIAGGILSGFGSFAGLALWGSRAENNFALTGNYIEGTLAQTLALGKFLLSAQTPPSAYEVAKMISEITGRKTEVSVSNFYITSVDQSTTSASLDTGIIRLDNTQKPESSTQTHYLYNLNENLIMYSSKSVTPDIIAPDSICYYSETTGRGFSNASDDLALYFDQATGKSTGKTVSIIKVAAVKQFYEAPGVVSSFAELLRNIGYAGALPYPEK